MCLAFGFSMDLQQLLAENWTAVSTPFFCRVTLFVRCRCCGEKKIAASCSRGGAEKLPAENVCNVYGCENGPSLENNMRAQQKPWPGEIRLIKPHSFPKRSHEGILVLCWRFLPIIWDYLSLNVALCGNYCPECHKKVPWALNIGLLVN